MNTPRLLTLTLLLAICVFTQAQDSEEPLLRVACFTDVHSQSSMINCTKVEDVKIRPAFTSALKKLKAEEPAVDVLVLQGDLVTGYTIPYENWNRAASLYSLATRQYFKSGAPRNVLYVTGNHDYEAGNFSGVPKEYNAANYYNTQMKKDIGTLADSDAFWEYPENGTQGTMKILSAYHYVISDFHFVVLNCGKHFFADSWDYQYSQESIDWCERKLEEITADNPDRTVIFLAHMPLPKSVGCTPDKTLKTTVTSSANLEKMLAKFPGVIYLYGHDHSSNVKKSYYETSLLQRFTQYDTKGNVIPAIFNDENGTNSTMLITLQSSGLCLGYNDYNLSYGTTKGAFLLDSSPLTPGAFQLQDPTNDHRFVYCGSNGRFSGKDIVSENTTIHIYDADGKPVTGPQVNNKYFFVSKTTSASGKYYALAPEMFNKNTADQRVGGTEVGTDLDNLDFKNAKGWVIRRFKKEDQKCNPSYFSLFVGSMRYNDLNTNVSPDTNESQVCQALIMSVYDNRIVMKLKNFAQTGTIAGTAVTAYILDPVPELTLYRNVSPASGVETLAADRAVTSQHVYDITGRNLGRKEDLRPTRHGIHIIDGRKVVR